MVKNVPVNIIIVLIASVVGSGLTSCKTCIPGVSLYVRGSMTTVVDSSGAFAAVEVVTAGDTMDLPTITLRGEKDTGIVRVNDPFILNVPDVIDLGKLSIRVDRRYDGTFAVTLGDACLPRIVLREKCEIINWYNPYRLPNIEVGTGNLDQVIATPIITGQDYIAGYEIRLGDQGVSDCTSPAYAAWLKRYRGAADKASADKATAGKATVGKAKVLALSLSKATPSPLTTFQKTALRVQRHR